MRETIGARTARFARAAVSKVQSAARRAAAWEDLGGWTASLAFTVGWSMVTSAVAAVTSRLLPGLVSSRDVWFASFGIFTIAGSAIYGLALAQRPSASNSPRE